MRQIDFSFFLRIALIIIVLFVLSFPLNKCYAQWDVKELHSLSGKVTNGDMVVIGDLDGKPGNEIVWLVSEQGGIFRIMILDGENGEIQWRSKAYYKIFPSSLKIGDTEGKNHNELIFTGQLTSFDPISMYVVWYVRESYSDSQATTSPSPNSSPAMKQMENLTQNSSPLKTETKPSTPELQPPLQNQKQTVSQRIDSIPVPPKAPIHFLPDNITATIPYSVTEKTTVRVDVFDGTGDVVRTLVKEECEPGKFLKTWDGTDDKGHKLPFGTYFYTVTLGKSTQVRKPIIFQP